MSTLDERIAEWEAGADPDWKVVDYHASLMRDLIARVRELEAGTALTQVFINPCDTCENRKVWQSQLAERDRTIEELRRQVREYPDLDSECERLETRLAAAQRELELCRSAVREYLDYRAETATPIVADAGPLLWLQACALRAGEGGER